MAEPLDIALIQTRTPATSQAGLDHVAPLIRQAAAGGAQLVLTPEATNRVERRSEGRASLAHEGEDVAVAGLCALARELGIWLQVGSVMVRAEDDEAGRAANRALLIDPEGRITARYDKLHVFDVDLDTGESWRESKAVRAGGRAVVADTPWGGLGLSICYDVRFPQLYRDLAGARSDVRMITVPAAFTVPTGEAHWEILLRARAIETGAFVLAAAQGGTHEDGRATWGRSTVVDPWGKVIAALDHDQPGVLHARLDLDAVDRARRAIPSLTHDRPFRSASDA
ncbi:carbon-nitrogen hydrolase family protein [Brevundimonas sp.]|uniref:carbon-nitrogen hydrolase family protein n=1 Tax=Brevundimonas sp. TaxID=1871086 RepID=UPI001DE94E2F|nr:carbon-nitrogen hydrolase family protein [Brevundimonas sp.]MBL0947877.1 carbon-nitrogen hydrolase family protein [Brevundimonas sp.]